MKLLKVLLIFTSIIMMPALSYADPQTVIAIQPLGELDKEVVEKVITGIKNMYNADVIILTERRMPEYAYYKPRKRYRAEKVLYFLDNIKDKPFTKILGLTTEDISTTRGEHVDWGIMGYGALGKRPCVVSTYRLNHGKASRKLFLTRLVKIVNHELGHTFGLDHCSNKGCVVEDVKGRASTIDSWTGEFCSTCKKRLMEQHLLNR